MEKLVNLLTLFKSCQSTVLPQNRSGIRKSACKTLVTALQCSVAKFHSLVKNLPEFIKVLACAESDINKIYSHNTLIESAVIFRLAVFVNIRSKEASATHTGKAMSLAVFINFALEHNLLRDIVGNHSLCGTFCSKLRKIPILAVLCYVILLKHINKLWKRRCNPHTLFIFYALVTLFECFFNNHSEVVLFLLVFSLIKIHKHGYKRSLTVCCEQSNNLILNGLNTTVYFFAKSLLNDIVDFLFCGMNTEFFDFRKSFSADFLTGNLNKRCKMSKAYALTAVLVTCNLCNNLSCNVTRR